MFAILYIDDHQCDTHSFSTRKDVWQMVLLRYICSGTGSPSWFELGSLWEKIFEGFFLENLSYVSFERMKRS